MPVPRMARAMTSWPRVGPGRLGLGLAIEGVEGLIERKDGRSQGKFTDFVGRGVDFYWGGVWDESEGEV